MRVEEFQIGNFDLAYRSLPKMGRVGVYPRQKSSVVWIVLILWALRFSVSGQIAV
jgi:hypothetical protein